MGHNPAESSVYPNGDATTQAIHRLTQALRGKIYDSEHISPAATDAPPAENPVEQAATDGPAPAEPTDLPPEHTNRHLENLLITHRTLGKHSMAHRQILGCLGCKLATQPGTTGTVRSMEIADCTDAENTPVRRTLKRLTKAGFLETEKRGKEPNGTRPDYFKFTERGSQGAFRRRLEVPKTCGQGQGEGNRLNAAAESILIEESVLAKRRAARMVLGCLACRLEVGKGVFAKGLQMCAGSNYLKDNTMLDRMAEAGVLDANPQPVNGKAGVIYTLANTELAKRVAEVLEKPEYCGIEHKI